MFHLPESGIRQPEMILRKPTLHSLVKWASRWIPERDRMIQHREGVDDLRVLDELDQTCGLPIIVVVTSANLRMIDSGNHRPVGIDIPLSASDIMQQISFNFATQQSV